MYLLVSGASSVAGCVGQDHPHRLEGLFRLLPVVLDVELGEREPVAARRIDAAPLGCHHPRLDPARALVEIGDPARLAHLAVVDDVDARLRLPAHDVRDGT